MKFRIPYTISTLDRLKKKSKPFNFLVRNKKAEKLKLCLESSNIKITTEEYLSICFRSFAFFFTVIYVISTTALVLTNVRLPYLISLGLTLAFSLFIFFSQYMYPRIYNTKREKNIERNLIPALEDMLVQLNSGIPLFNILVNISSSKYEALSDEFKKAVKKINAGLPQIEVLEELSEKNPSKFFKRTLWQLSNGMRAGSDISIVIEESIKTLNEEQLLQIQNYGNRLNPLIMFYMVISVILPAISIAFLTILSSMLGLTQNTTTLLFMSVLVFTTLIQIMFLGMIKSIRPSLL